ncbi:unnamed protein product [Pseudo-nitzschia multistriata]|uniref:Uncharacterized protein n=1 Tax=Pseudo-nitzschia multistriata TaxID=183589 RepID=A0A448Z4A9_9STRA|nr:unnamed protein product [Pseudo-nitzschia multistriata]
MRIHRSIVSALAATAGFASYSEAFAAPRLAGSALAAPGLAARPSTPLFSTTEDAEAAPCDAPSGVEKAVLENASALTGATLTNHKGETVVLGDLLQKDTSNVVVFLRHMGIGDEEKLGAFLEQNPAIDPGSMLVDGYGFDAYEAAGFGKFTDVDPETAKQVKMEAPGLSFGQWMGYFRAVGKTSPIPKGMGFGEIPEGVLRLGGTFVVRNDEVLYQWSDRLPGDHPDLTEVVTLAVAKAGK